MNNTDRKTIRKVIETLEQGERLNEEQDNYWNPAREAISRTLDTLKMLIGDPV